MRRFTAGDYYKRLSNSVFQRKGLNNPITLEKTSVRTLWTRDYLVTEKTDGMRYILFVYRDQLFRADRLGNTQLVPGITYRLRDRRDEVVLDAEYIKDNDGQERYYIFDALKLQGDYIYKNPLDVRLRKIGTFLRSTRWGDRFQVKPMWSMARLDYVLGVYLPKAPHLSDGLIFTPKRQGYQGRFKTYKWKPPTLNSIDFKVNLDNQLCVRGGQPKEEIDPNEVQRFRWRHGIPSHVEFVGECVFKNGRWKLIRLRRDKDDGNALRTYQSVKRSIQTPVDLHFIRTFDTTLYLPDVQDRSMTQLEKDIGGTYVEREIRFGSGGETYDTNIGKDKFDALVRCMPDTISVESTSYSFQGYRKEVFETYEEYVFKRKVGHDDRGLYRIAYAFEIPVAAFVVPVDAVVRHKKRYTCSFNLFRIDATIVNGESYEFEIELYRGTTLEMVQRIIDRVSSGRYTPHMFFLDELYDIDLAVEDKDIGPFIDAKYTLTYEQVKAVADTNADSLSTKLENGSFFTYRTTAWLFWKAGEMNHQRLRDACERRLRQQQDELEDMLQRYHWELKNREKYNDEVSDDLFVAIVNLLGNENITEDRLRSINTLEALVRLVHNDSIPVFDTTASKMEQLKF